MADGGGWDRIGPLEQKPAEIPENQAAFGGIFKKQNQDFRPHSLKQRSRLLLRLGLGLLLCSQHPVDAPDGQVHLLLRVVVIKLTQVGY